MNHLPNRIFRLSSCGLGKQYLSNLSNLTQPTANSLSVGPSVRLLLTLYDVQPSDVVASGPHGRLLKGDVLSFINNKGLEPKPFRLETTPLKGESQPPVAAILPPVSSIAKRSSTRTTAPAQDSAEWTDLDISGMRKTIAKRLSQSKATIPHQYSTIDCDASELIKLRKRVSKEGVAVSVNDFIVKACAVALNRVPEMNSILSGEEITPLSSIDVAVAVATDSGLITPIVVSADQKCVSEISSDIKELAGKAREGKLRPHEFQGGSFTISNLGMFGIKEFTAVINPPQSSILAVGGLQPALDAEGRLKSYISLTLSSDLRVVDEATVSHFLSTVRSYLERPQTLLL